MLLHAGSLSNFPLLKPDAKHLSQLSEPPEAPYCSHGFEMIGEFKPFLPSRRNSQAFCFGFSHVVEVPHPVLVLLCGCYILLPCHLPQFFLLLSLLLQSHYHKVLAWLLSNLYPPTALRGGDGVGGSDRDG